MDDPGSGVAAETIANEIMRLQPDGVERHVLLLTPFDCEHKRKANESRTLDGPANKPVQFEPICSICTGNGVVAAPRKSVDFNRFSNSTDEFALYVQRAVANRLTALSSRRTHTGRVGVCALDVHTCLEQSFWEIKQHARQALGRAVATDAIVLLLPFIEQSASAYHQRELDSIHNCIAKVLDQQWAAGDPPVCAGQGSDVNMA